MNKYLPYYFQKLSDLLRLPLSLLDSEGMVFSQSNSNGAYIGTPGEEHGINKNRDNRKLVDFCDLFCFPKCRKQLILFTRILNLRRHSL